jgi:hypothetical protein
VPNLTRIAGKFAKQWPRQPGDGEAVSQTTWL